MKTIEAWNRRAKSPTMDDLWKDLERLEDLAATTSGDAEETYSSGYRDGQIELLRRILKTGEITCDSGELERSDGMGRGIASGYEHIEITICSTCFHRDVCGDKDYLTENKCAVFVDEGRCVVLQAMIAPDEATKFCPKCNAMTEYDHHFGRHMCTHCGWRSEKKEAQE